MKRLEVVPFIFPGVVSEAELLYLKCFIGYMLLYPHFLKHFTGTWWTSNITFVHTLSSFNHLAASAAATPIAQNKKITMVLLNILYITVGYYVKNNRVQSWSGPQGKGYIRYARVPHRNLMIITLLRSSDLCCALAGETGRAGDAVKTWKRGSWRGAVQTIYSLALVREWLSAPLHL